MAKSAGGFIRLQTLIDRYYDPLAFRYLYLKVHYRGNLNFTWESLEAAAVTLNRLRRVFYEWQLGDIDKDYVTEFLERINDDLNMPRALSLCWELIKSSLPISTKKATLLNFDKEFGLCLDEWYPREQIIPNEIKILVEERQKSRTEKRFEEADELRNQIVNAGYIIEDTPNGPNIRVK